MAHLSLAGILLVVWLWRGFEFGNHLFLNFIFSHCPLHDAHSLWGSFWKLSLGLTCGFTLWRPWRGSWLFNSSNSLGLGHDRICCLFFLCGQSIWADDKVNEYFWGFFIEHTHQAIILIVITVLEQSDPLSIRVEPPVEHDVLGDAYWANAELITDRFSDYKNLFSRDCATKWYFDCIGKTSGGKN